VLALAKHVVDITVNEIVNDLGAILSCSQCEHGTGCSALRDVMDEVRHAVPADDLAPVSRAAMTFFSFAGLGCTTPVEGADNR
jgi:hypothetical protein